MKSKNKEGDIKIDDKYLSDVMMNFLIAGRDTTAQALSWSLFLLCQHPDIQEQVFQEARDTVQRNREAVASGTPNPGEDEEELLLREEDDEHISFENTKTMPYARAVFLETLRLYPSVPKEAKWAFEEDTLPDGTHIPKNCWVGFIPYVMGRDEHLWPEPQRFDPGRFLAVDSETGVASTVKPSPYVFTAFQAGPRMCLGKDMAVLEGQVALSRLCLNYKFSLACDPEEVTYTNSLTLPMKNGLPVRVEMRV